ncbi:MAG: hypothetical protein ACF8OB_13745 [Phycisphaeraceae bacterium JB051]
MKLSRMHGLACLLAGFIVAPLSADVVLQADFDAADKLVTTGGKGSIVAYSTNKATVATDQSLAKASGGYLSVDARPDSKPGHAGGVKIKPQSAQSSLAAMSQIVDGKVVLNGAFDFFFRANAELDKGMSVMRVLDHKGAADGLRLVYLSHDGKPRVEILGPKGKAAPFKRANGRDASVIAPEIGLIMEADTVYHMALGFETAADGMVSMTMYAAEGNVALDKSMAMATTKFTLNADSVKSGFGEGEFFFGKSGQAGTPIVQDFDCLRLYNQLPDTFEALK